MTEWADLPALTLAIVLGLSLVKIIERLVDHVLKKNGVVPGKPECLYSRDYTELQVSKLAAPLEDIAKMLARHEAQLQENRKAIYSEADRVRDAIRSERK